MNCTPPPIVQETGYISVRVDDVFVKRHNECYINPNNIDCDAYDYKRNI